MVGSDERTKRILIENKAMIKHSHEVINPPLSLQQMGGITVTQLGHFGGFINRIKDGQEVDLFRFITREITAATMHSFYGPNNPFALDPELIEAFWDWEWEIVAYMTGVLPSIFARKAKSGLERCVKGFEKYAEAGGYRDARSLVQNRKLMHEEAGITPHEHARLELGLCFGFNSNASITTFWVLNNIFSRPELLAELREEIEKERPCHTRYDLLPQVEGFLSASQFYLQRDHEDHVAHDIRSHGGIIHKDASIWGPDVSCFNPRRFQYNWHGSKADDNGNMSNAKADQVHAAAFRGFGGGASLCPGRHVAQMEVLSLTAAMVCAFDVLPPQGKSEVNWDPPRDDKRFPFSTLKPLRELRVQLKRRVGMENTHWTLQA
ncbi:hypothetical protein N0V90_008950 [Kalmusia sp. IMI 367209]|nr:hypothetical protein N0V90_008950 [Kalmusia sp. IMI 367209]